MSNSGPFSPDEKRGLTFPCEFVIKVFGLASDEFSKTVLLLIRKHLPDLPDQAVQNRPSKDGKYLAFSITVNVTSQAQLDAIYRELTSDPAVLMVL